MLRKGRRKMWTDRQLVSFFEVATPITPEEIKQDAMGLELEIELNPDLNYRDLTRFVERLGWSATHDNSLRGSSMELVTAPKTIEEHTKDLTEFDSFLSKKYKGQDVIIPSHRCSTHVHLNFSKDGTKDTLKFLALYYLFERVLIELANPDRKDNTFCVSSDINPFKIAQNIEDRKHFTKGITDRDHSKYASLNFTRIHDLGTIESRIMHGYTKAEKTIRWLKVLHSLKVAARDVFQTLEDINKTYLETPCTSFLKDVFGESTDDIERALVLKNCSLKERLAAGYRTAFSILQYSNVIEEGVKNLPEAKQRLEEAQREKERKVKELFNEYQQVQKELNPLLERQFQDIRVRGERIRNPQEQVQGRQARGVIIDELINPPVFPWPVEEEEDRF